MYKEEAYEKARQGGYAGRVYAPNLGTELLDPHFWECLGKTMGLSEGVEYSPTPTEKLKISVGWRMLWHSFIDHLADSGTSECFFKELLK